MLRNKICVVTGAAQGIGRATAELFARNHASAVFACDANTGTMRGWANSYFNIIPVSFDVCDRPAIRLFVEKIASGRIDVLVNNAGVTRGNMLDRLAEQDWDFAINVNLKGVFNMTQAIAPIMMAQGIGSIITMSSVAGIDGNIRHSNYAAAKGGIIAMTKGWAGEFTRKGAQVRVNCIVPGFIEAPMTVNLPEKVLACVKHKTPLRRLGTAEEVAQGALFLASDHAAFITGQTLKIDGGLVI